MQAFAAYGCLICGSNEVVATITIEKRGVLGHYPSCAADIEKVVQRVVADLPAPSAPSDVDTTSMNHPPPPGSLGDAH